MSYFVFFIISYLYVSCSGSSASVGKRELVCLLWFTFNYVIFLFREVTSSSW